ncbi:MAG: TetR family transcriptional regulator, partial [Bifidobacterium castoris]|nr:TetR family transcriptional regulator [Bifidobacterium castoris]
QTGLGGSATVSGLVLLPGSLCSIVMNPIAGRLFDKIGARGLTIVGSALSLIPMVLLAFTTTGTPLALIAGYNAIRCIGIALMMMPLLTWAMSGLRQSQTADGTALFNALN